MRAHIITFTIQGRCAGLVTLTVERQDGASRFVLNGMEGTGEIAPELTGQGLPLSKCEAYNRVYDQHLGSD